MADGSVKAIEDVQVGDWVWAEDPETGEKGARQVTDLIVGSGDKDLVRVVIDGHVITATDAHPFWVESRQAWVDAKDLLAGDIVLTAAGDTLTIDDVASYTLDVSAVHNLTVADLHTYYVLAGESSVLVHNTNCKPIDSSRPQHGTPKHDATAFNHAKKWENASTTKEARFNQQLVDADGNSVAGFRPDAQRIRKTSKGDIVDVVEVQSPTQTAKFMDAKVEAIRQKLGDQAGIIKWIKATDSKRL